MLVDERGERGAVVSDHGGEVAVREQFVGQFEGAPGEVGVVETDIDWEPDDLDMLNLVLGQFDFLFLGHMLSTVGDGLFRGEEAVDAGAAIFVGRVKCELWLDCFADLVLEALVVEGANRREAVRLVRRSRKLIAVDGVEFDHDGLADADLAGRYVDVAFGGTRHFELGDDFRLDIFVVVEERIDLGVCVHLLVECQRVELAVADRLGREQVEVFVRIVL